MTPNIDAPLNRIFSTLDTQSHATLVQFLTQYPLQVHCSSPAVSLQCFVVNQHISVRTSWFKFDAASHDIQPAITLSGDVHALLSLAHSTKGVIPEGVHIEGQVHALENLQRMLSHIDMDWPALLEQWIGSGPTHIVTSALLKMMQFGQRQAKQIYDDTSAYVIEEKKSLLTQSDFTSHRQRLATLRLTIDRAEAKLHHLSQQLRTRAK